MKELIALLENTEGFNQDYSKHGDGATAIANFINAGRDLSYILDTIRNPPLECPAARARKRGSVLAYLEISFPNEHFSVVMYRD